MRPSLLLVGGLLWKALISSCRDQQLAYAGIGRLIGDLVSWMGVGQWMANWCAARKRRCPSRSRQVNLAVSKCRAKLPNLMRLSKEQPNAISLSSRYKFQDWCQGSSRLSQSVLVVFDDGTLGITNPPCFTDRWLLGFLHGGLASPPMPLRYNGQR